MLFYDGRQYLEGIDSIDVLLQPYFSVDSSRQVDPKNLISIYSTRAEIPKDQYSSAYKYFEYLHISGEYINPERPIIDTIAQAISELFLKKIIAYVTPERNKDKLLVWKELSHYSKEYIADNINLFITSISGIEFCFDFEEDKITISEDTEIITPTGDYYNQFLHTKLPDRPKCLIQIGSTFYSYDYKKKRKSILKLYDRSIWLKKKNNEYSHKVIDNNPYIKRIEFVLKLNRNTKYLTIDNLAGNYNTIINKYINYLALMYRKYFLGKVIVNPDNHPHFTQIYLMAHNPQIKRNPLLQKSKSINKDKKRDLQSTYESNIYAKGRNEERRYIKKIENPPDSYFAFPNTSEKRAFIIPSDYENKENIAFTDEVFTFFKDAYRYTPKLEDFKEIKDDDTNINE